MCQGGFGLCFVEIDLQEGLLEGVEGLLLDGWFELTFPYSDAVPSEGGELLEGLCVAGFVAVDFTGPEIGVGFGDAVGGTAIVSVPEAAVDEDAGCVLTKNDVGMSGQTGMIKTETESMGKKIPADDDLRLGVLGVYRRHVFVTLFRREFVHWIFGEVNFSSVFGHQALDAWRGRDVHAPQPKTFEGNWEKWG